MIEVAIDSGTEREIAVTLRLVEDVITANHCWLVSEGHSRNGPRLATELRIDLNQNLVDDGSQVLASSDRVVKDDLRRNWHLLEEFCLDLVIQRRTILVALEDKDAESYILIEL